MSLKSVSGVVFYVKDLDKTAKFYESLGFKFKKRTLEYATAYLNWFWLDFVAQGKEVKSQFQKEAHAGPKGAGLFININVDDVDEFYKALLSRGLKPSNKPRDWPWGRREFVLRDPDGYKLVFFEKK